MNLGVSDSLRPLLETVRSFINEKVVPRDEEFLAEVGVGDRF